MTFSLEPLPPTDTPDDYIRLQFDPANVPPKRIVGLLACQRDPLLRKLYTKLHAARPAAIAAVPTQKGKGIKKKDRSGTSTPANGASGTQTPTTEGPATPIGRLWEVELDDTVIFPEGGGQPSDTGTLTLTDNNGGATRLRVEMCIRRKLESIHLVRVPPDYEHVLESAEAGDVIQVEVDWTRRVDQMTIHTAQHLLSAVLDTYNLPTLSWAMHAYPSLECPYVELERQLTWKEAEEVESKCNALIDEARRVWIEVSLQGEAGQVSDSRGMPVDYEGGVIRHCCIDSTDRNACCGTQLPNIGLCRIIHVLPPTLAADSNTPSKSATKLFFTAGPRANRYLPTASRQLSTVAQALACSRDNAAERSAKVDDLRKEQNTILEAMRKEMARFVADSARREAENGVVYVQRGEKGTHDFDFLGQVASAVLAGPAQGDVLTGKQVVLCVSAVDGAQGGLVLVQSMDDALAKDLKERIANALDGVPLQGGDQVQGKRVKGGGAKGRYMCKVDGKIGKREKEAVMQVVQAFRAERGDAI